MLEVTRCAIRGQAQAHGRAERTDRVPNEELPRPAEALGGSASGLPDAAGVAIAYTRASQSA